MQLWVVAIGAAVAEFWWVAPAAAGAGAVGFVGVRRGRSTRARRLGLHAAQRELQQARSDAIGARAAARVAQAELTRMEAERAAGRVRPEDVRLARRALDDAQRAKASATATIRVARARVGAERAAVPARGTDPQHLPLARLMASHDAVAARWMEYETDAARRLAFPALSDARVPATSEFLRLEGIARELRPASALAKTSPDEFAAYRSAVDAVRRAFDAAEQEAWRLAGHRPEGVPNDPPLTQRWTVVATEALARSVDGLTRAAEGAASALDAYRSRRDGRDRDQPRP
ncbi:hypothetical protein KZX37_03330 [Microbacterium sp. EYE_5]|uniref:hypothetical protein n=1 Tax=unclassified Microbacterium TaxID=2609290 RepID=UPI0020049FBF|nr:MULTISPECIES: hypothetical protein [unclassified Microbacterium]MCK6079651.1 hypothetical protein [Microbacterium sp. EYE_382]MCK6084922.1 hypothetical protein [Microbacterium sp. EYE_384]MCK6122852.1 hypothetical protein [Microbacterium sp. EYE_80]MCK6125685.1 hypothetical protein [Microbacterium sp. EYE_79]MCK6140606.1 hypothetical protein [Microbacterium sp. EYE_39]